MAHQIENNMMAYKGAEPWHGLGFKVDENTTGAEMLVTAGLDWRVQRRNIAMRPSNADKSTMLTSQLDEYRAIVRSDNDTVFQVGLFQRKARLVELDPRYCDVIIRRWQSFTGKAAVLAADCIGAGRTFAELEAERKSKPAAA